MLADPDGLTDWLTYSRLSSSPSSAQAVARIYRDTDIRNVLPAVRAPTLVLHRTGDRTEALESGRYVASKIPGARFVELPGDDSHPWLGDAASVLGEVKAFVTGSTGAGEPDRMLATLLFTDIVGSTERAASSLGDREWRDLLGRYHSAVRAQLAQHRRVEIDATGDGALAASMVRRERCGALSRSRTPHEPSISRFVPASTRARSRSTATMSEDSPCTSVPAWPRGPAPPRFSSPRPSGTSPPGQASPSRTPASTS